MGEKIMRVEPLVDIDEAIEATGLERDLLRDKEYRERYDIPHYKIGKRVKYRVSELLKWIEERKVV